MQPNKCPVCYGKGAVKSDFYSPFEVSPDVVKITPTVTIELTETCRTCNGSGIIWTPAPQFPEDMI